MPTPDRDRLLDGSPGTLLPLPRRDHSKNTRHSTIVRMTEGSANYSLLVFYSLQEGSMPDSISVESDVRAI
jgi:hypothetical protein